MCTVITSISPSDLNRFLFAGESVLGYGALREQRLHGDPVHAQVGYEKRARARSAGLERAGIGRDP